MVGIYFPILAQNKALPIYTAATNSKAYIIIVNAPQEMEGFNVYRKAPGENNFNRLTQKPVTAIVDPGIIKAVLKDDYEWVNKALRAADDFEIVRRLQSDPGTSAVLSLSSLNVAKAAGRLFVDDSVEQNKTYTYKVEFINYEGKILGEVERDIKIIYKQPPAPTVVKSDAGDNLIKISWDYPAYKGDPNDIVVGFNIYRDNGERKFEKINDVLILRQEDIKYRTDINVINNKPYNYFVKSVDCIGRESISSNQVTATPVDITPPKYPEGLNTFAEEGQITLTWKMNLELDVSYYDVYRSLEVLETYEKINKGPIAADQPYYFDKDVFAGPSYYYKVQAIDSSGNISEFSNSISGKPADSTAPSLPNNVTAVVVGQYVRLKWDALPDKDLKGFYVYKRRSDLEFLRVVNLPIDTLGFYDTGYKNEGLWQGRTYYYGVTAVDNFYNESEMKIVKVLIPDNDPPKTPVSSYARSNDDGIVEVTWQPSMSLDAAKYRIYRSEGNETAKILIETPDSIYKSIDSSAARGITYGYQVAAVDSFGNESLKTEKTTVVPADIIAPPSPVEIKATSSTNGVRITWRAVSVDDLFGYNVYSSYLPNGITKKLNNEPLHTTEFFDPTGVEGTYYIVSSLDTSLHENKSQAEEATK